MSDEGRLVAGRYRLTRRIGSGAMGVVWQAHDERLYRTVGIKQLLLQTGMSAAESHEAKQRAMREGRIAARLQHQHAISVYDVIEVDGNPWLIMEYLPSKSLAAVLRQHGTLAPRETARIAFQTATALEAAHAAGIVHRDIKPGNILIGDDGTVKITDFGISRATGDVTVTATGMLAGTPAYLAPEVAKGYDPGPPSDVFSLGSTIYAMVEGEPPFGLNENTLALLHAVAAGQILPPRKAGPLAPLLSRMLCPRPEERPTMAQAREALGAVAAGRPIQPAILGAMPMRTARTEAIPGANRNSAIGYPAGTTVATAPRPTATRLDPRPLDRAGTDTGPGLDVPTGETSGTNLTDEGRGGKRAMVLTGLAVVAVIVIGILVASSFTGIQSTGQTDGQQQNGSLAGPGKTSSSPKQGGNKQSGSPSSAPGSADPSASSSGQQSKTPTPQELEQVVREYFAYLPDDVDSAFAMLSPNMQSSVNGAQAYQNFWSAISFVRVSKVTGTTDSVSATVEYHYKNGKVVADSDIFSFTLSGTNILIDGQNTGSTTTISNPATSATTTPAPPSSTTSAVATSKQSS